MCVDLKNIKAGDKVECASGAVLEVDFVCPEKCYVGVRFKGCTTYLTYAVDGKALARGLSGILDIVKIIPKPFTRADLKWGMAFKNSINGLVSLYVGDCPFNPNELIMSGYITQAPYMKDITTFLKLSERVPELDKTLN